MDLYVRISLFLAVPRVCSYEGDKFRFQDECSVNRGKGLGWVKIVKSRLEVSILIRREYRLIRMYCLKTK